MSVASYTTLEFDFRGKETEVYTDHLAVEIAKHLKSRMTGSTKC